MTLYTVGKLLEKPFKKLLNSSDNDVHLQKAALKTLGGLAVTRASRLRMRASLPKVSFRQHSLKTRHHSRWL
jgi:hypothetical protein